MQLLESTQHQSDFPERDYCMVVLFLNCGMRLAELVGMDLGDIDLEQRQIRLVRQRPQGAYGLPE